MAATIATHRDDSDQFILNYAARINEAVKTDDLADLEFIINEIYEAGFADGQESTGAYIPEESEE